MEKVVKVQKSKETFKPYIQMFYLFFFCTANVYEYKGLYMRGHYIQRVVYSNNNRLGRAWCWVPRDVMRSTEI